MSQHTGSHENSLNLLGEKYLNESHWPMRRIRLLECNFVKIPEQVSNSSHDNCMGKIFKINLI